MTREHFFNAEFDLSLRPGWSLDNAPGMARQIRDLALLGVAAAAEDESVVLYEELPDDFCRWLDRHGFELPTVSLYPKRRPGSVLAPFGWNQHAAELDRGSAVRAEGPPLAVVQRVNDRRFADRVAAEALGEDEHVLGVARSPAAVARLLARDRDHADGWVVKARHGNSALGHRRLRRADLDAAETRMLARLLAADPVVTVERWRRRVCDLSATFDVAPGGRVRDVALHEVVNTSAGAYLGAVFEPRDDGLERWREAVVAAVGVAGKALTQAGYFGPACLDAFVWRDGSRLRLRRLVELNARGHLSAGFRRLAERWQGRRTVHGRLLSCRRLRMPPDYAALDSALGEDRFDAARGSGVLLISPLWLGAGRRRPRRVAVAFIADQRRTALAMAARFRARFEE